MPSAFDRTNGRGLVLRTWRQQLGISLPGDRASCQGLWCGRHDQRRQWTNGQLLMQEIVDRGARAYGWDMLDKPPLR